MVEKETVAPPPAEAPARETKSKRDFLPPRHVTGWFILIGALLLAVYHALTWRRV